MHDTKRDGWETARDLGYVALRLALGVIFFAHGAQKMLGWYGGHGFESSVQALSSGMGVPAWLAGLAILTEFFGGIAVILGVFSRLAGLGLAVTMVVAGAKAHLASGFFINWSGTPGVGHGIEMNFALLGMALLVALAGPGNWALAGDTERTLLARRLGGRSRKSEPQTAPQTP